MIRRGPKWRAQRILTHLGNYFPENQVDGCLIGKIFAGSRLIQIMEKGIRIEECDIAYEDIQKIVYPFDKAKDWLEIETTRFGKISILLDQSRTFVRFLHYVRMDISRENPDIEVLRLEESGRAADV